MLKLNQVSKRYHSFHFGPIDMLVEPGTVTAIVGPNGSGKSTLLRLIMGLIQPDHGEIEWDGESFNKHEERIKRQMGYVSTHLYDIFGHLTINALAQFVSHWFPRWCEERWLGYLDRYEIDPSKKYSDCSTGTKKKVDFILALAHQPSLLLLDEPSSGLDMVSQRKMREDLLEYMEYGSNSIIIATHLQDEVQQLCDYICLLDDGELIEAFEKDEDQYCWAKLWISSMPEKLKAHPNVKEISGSSGQGQIVTDNLSVMTSVLQQEEVTVSHIQRLELNERIEYALKARQAARL